MKNAKKSKKKRLTYKKDDLRNLSIIILLLT